ncbi:MAG: hypothetical protein AB8I08_03720 [Sandaracinaceae bacterium]
MPFYALLSLVLVFSVGCSGTHREDEVVDCTPGETLRVACAASEDLGACSGDPVLEICDGTQSSCDTSTAIARNDDATPETRCPGVDVVCPPRGPSW